MYQLRVIPLQNGEHKRERLIIEFDDSDMEIVAEFLMADAPLLRGKILSEIKQVLSGELASVTTNGNRCAVEVKSDVTTISDLFVDLYENVDILPTVQIETSFLQQLIQEWFQALDEFENISE